jgi:hypothetical protein
MKTSTELTSTPRASFDANSDAFEFELSGSTVNDYAIYFKTNAELGYLETEICVHCEFGTQDIFFDHWKIRQKRDCTKALSIDLSTALAGSIAPAADQASQTLLKTLELEFDSSTPEVKYCLLGDFFKMTDATYDTTADCGVPVCTAFI